MRFSAFAPLLAFLVSLLLLRALLRHGIAQAVLDQPNERSLHQHPVPRIGGIAVLAGVGVGWLMVGGSHAWPLLASVGVLVAVSALDDWRGLPIAWRLLTHGLVVAAYLFVAASGNLGVLTLFALWIGIIWMINLYNFMDGSDGMAGGMALIGFGAYGLAAWLGGDSEMMLLSLSVAAAAAGFLLFNFPPARVFMGDAGSIPLGFLAASLGLVGVIQGLWPTWFPVVVFAPFIVDATVTLFRRLLQGEKVWRAHRSHYYQRLVQMGWGHRRTALAEYALMGLTGVSAVWALDQPPAVQNATFAVLGLTYIGLMVWLDRKWSAFLKRHSGDIVCE